MAIRKVEGLQKVLCHYLPMTHQAEMVVPCSPDCNPELRRIQQEGKCLLISVSTDQIEPLMSELSSRGLYLLTWAATEDEAREIAKNVTKWTHE